ncbi:ubiquitin carboxyl-terminal hydrolase 2 isoform X5 [Hyalella azteca]|uniref:ubiquitinyl hydrolase 1 n=1 Tax=Hyalella azteca TaxID=294128 RepID=A0A8B7NFW6_HYAAZ|nr:ubiquitin carboxyl-terminal hydrolase 2 isoform X5 [Hyalella azteca]
MVNFFLFCFTEDSSKYKVSSPQNQTTDTKSKSTTKTMQPSSTSMSPKYSKRTRHASDASRGDSDSSASSVRGTSPNKRLQSPSRTSSPHRLGFRSSTSSTNSVASNSSKSSSSSLSSDHSAMSMSSTPPSSSSASSSSNSTPESSRKYGTDTDDDSPPVGRKPKGGFSESSGLVGLRNIGNTCFLNSVTQCLSNTRCLLEYLVKEGYSSDINTSLSTMKGDLIRAFGNLISEMWTEGDSNRALNTGPFKTQIQKFAPTFTGYQQHDAQEFLRKLLEGLHEDVNRVTVRPRPIHTDIDDDLSDDQKAMESWKRYLRFDDSKIVNMFVGQLKSSLQCSHCSHTSVTFDPFWDLSLPIPPKTGTVRLNQCLDLFTKEEVMDGDERPTCSKCKERRKMTKSFSIQKFPQVLVLHLKRFSPTERWRGKLSCTVEFPVENLDLSKYASSSRSSCNYNLIGVANHSGTTYSGHYTAFCRHPYSLQWHEYNDSRVTPIPARRVCSSEAYVLFYELSSASKL